MKPEKAIQSSGGTGFQPVSGFKGTRRNLPHLQEAGRTYFVTFRVGHGTMPNKAREVALAASLFWNGKKYQVHACVVMPDHVHLLLTPLPVGDHKGYHSLSEILHGIKSYSANRINRLLKKKGSFWLDESYDRIMRSEEEFLEKRNYIRNNPVRRELAKHPGEYPFLYEEHEG
ncbi:hypothetical protein AMJ85_01260 [candidate division BRC1 bacterium SM23_51]|nr:MAG: hypothetical protein AMJ85_01260 [candidate division BRC1 bacterium SM23_51]